MSPKVTVVKTPRDAKNPQQRTSAGSQRKCFNFPKSMHVCTPPTAAKITIQHVERHLLPASPALLKATGAAPPARMSCTFHTNRHRQFPSLRELVLLLPPINCHQAVEENLPAHTSNCVLFCCRKQATLTITDFFQAFLGEAGTTAMGQDLLPQEG